MTQNKILFSHFKPLLKLILVNLLNSHKVRVIHSRTSSIFSNPKLHNILSYLISIQFFLSAHKLCRELNMYILFTSTSYLIFQGPSVKSPLKVARDQRRLYILKSGQVKSVRCFSKESSQEEL